MREHQIIITLKPDQFLLVQKLAREAGAKSMGLFVRQQLLIALGMEAGASAPQSQAVMAGSAGPDLEPIKNELKVLHAQLREIVAESLTSYSDDLASAEPEPAADFAEGLPSAAIKFAMEDTAYGGASDNLSDLGSINESFENGFEEGDELEQIAKKTFAISPRLGEFDNVAAKPFESEFAQAGAQTFPEFSSQGEPVSGRENPPLPPAASAFIPGTPRAPALQPFGQSPSTTSEHSQFVSPKPLEPGRRAPLSGEPPVVPNSSILDSRNTSLESSTAKAQSQQADSPRDPLSDLLDSSDTEAAKFASPEEADDESFDVPLSIMTRRRQMEALAKALAEGSKETGSTNAVSSQPPQRANKADLSEKSPPPDKLAQVQPEEPKPADSQSVSGTYQRYNPLGNPDEDSPFSGGPPPKKRQ